MSKNVSYKKLTSLLCGVFFFIITVKIVFHAARHHINLYEVNEEWIIYSEFIKIYGYIIASFILVIFSYVNTATSLLISIALFTTAGFLLIIKIYYMLPQIILLMAICVFSYFVIIIVEIAEYHHPKNHLGITLFFIIFALGNLAADQLKHLVDTNTAFILTSIFSIIIVIFSIFFYKSQFLSYTRQNINFVELTKHTTLQNIIGFTAAYLAGVVFERYYNLNMEQDLILLDIWLLRKYAFLIVMIFAIPMHYLFIKFNKYSLNLFLLLLLLINFFVVSETHMHALMLTCVLSLISICLYGILIVNIMILTSKFDGNYLRTALLVYSAICSTGYYTGYTITSNLIDFMGAAGVIASSCGIIIICIMYYISRYFKYQLYRY